MKYCIAILFLFLLLPFVGCSDSDTTNSSTDLTGNLKGIIGAIDSNGVATERTGFKVELIGTSYSTVTDSTGYWEINNIPTRTYIIKYSKAGYQPYKSQFAFLGGSTIWLSDNNQVLLIRQPAKMKAELDLLSVGADSLTFQVGGLVSGHIFVIERTPVWFGSITLFGKSREIDITNRASYLYSYLSDGNRYYFHANTTPTSININIPIISPGNYFAIGDTMYCRMYACLTTIPTIGYQGFPVQSSGPDSFIDPETRAYTPIGTSEGSNILSAIVK
ncbi:MAG TPA: hypothetical protein VFO76_04435 [Candidatus Kapabacteria bacterium]|nr:hypothetical protein [Candidatus Kapabacteria bacterium]